MNRRFFLAVCLVCVVMTGCGRQEQPQQTTEAMQALETTPTETIPETTLPEPEDGDLVRIADYLPQVHQQLRYATADNFTGQVIYDFTDAYLRYGTVKKLAAVQDDLQALGLTLKIWDAYRPVSAQRVLWQVCPDPTYVANPNVGASSHSRGNTLDLTLTDGEGRELEMPTGFDDFSARADRDYSDCSQTAADNARILELLMEKHGFQGYAGEWWHYSDTQSYPVLEAFAMEP